MLLFTTSLPSPLAEKRINLFTIKNQMFGRRAYSDSIFKRGIRTHKILKEEPVVQYHVAHAEIEEKAMIINAC